MILLLVLIMMMMSATVLLCMHVGCVQLLIRPV